MTETPLVEVPELHPENAERIRNVRAVLHNGPISGRLEWHPGRHALREELEMLHPPAYVDSIQSFCAAGGGYLTQSTPVVCTASFAGKSTITAVDRLTGIAYSLGGNNQFQVDVTDAAEPGSSPGAGPDKYAIRVWNSSNANYYTLGTSTNQIALNGGNIQVHRSRPSHERPDLH